MRRGRANSAEHAHRHAVWLPLDDRQQRKEGGGRGLRAGWRGRALAGAAAGGELLCPRRQSSPKNHPNRWAELQNFRAPTRSSSPSPAAAHLHARLDGCEHLGPRLCHPGTLQLLQTDSALHHPLKGGLCRARRGVNREDGVCLLACEQQAARHQFGVANAQRLAHGTTGGGLPSALSRWRLPLSQRPPVPRLRPLARATPTPPHRPHPPPLPHSPTHTHTPPPIPPQPPAPGSPPHLQLPKADAVPDRQRGAAERGEGVHRLRRLPPCRALSDLRAPRGRRAVPGAEPCPKQARSRLAAITASQPPILPPGAHHTPAPAPSCPPPPASPPTWMSDSLATSWTAPTTPATESPRVCRWHRYSRSTSARRGPRPFQPAPPTSCRRGKQVAGPWCEAQRRMRAANAQHDLSVGHSLKSSAHPASVCGRPGTRNRQPWQQCQCLPPARACHALRLPCRRCPGMPAAGRPLPRT